MSVPVAPLLGTGAASAVGSISGLPSGMTQSEGEKARPRKRACLRGHRGVSGPSSDSLEGPLHSGILWPGTLGEANPEEQ